MSKEQRDPRFPIIDTPHKSESEVWMNIKEAATYGSMSTTRIYKAIEDGLQSRKNPVSNVIEVPREALEYWFCPFKGNTQYEDERVAEKFERQRTRISHLRSKVDHLRSHNEDLQDIIETLKGELEIAHGREAKLLEIIANSEKK